MLNLLSKTNRRNFWLALLLGWLSLVGVSRTVQAAYYGGRHYYSTWNYHPQRTYYYTRYYYKPAPAATNYSYHYCIHYTSQPRYVYYYNPVSHAYWGRYDMESKGYSQLAEKDQKGDLKDIPESAFPKPSTMPNIPESTDKEKMLEIDPATLPTEKTPDDAPAK